MKRRLALPWLRTALGTCHILSRKTTDHSIPEALWEIQAVGAGNVQFPEFINAEEPLGNPREASGNGMVLVVSDIVIVRIRVDVILDVRNVVAHDDEFTGTTGMAPGREELSVG
ncbi:hypothetical protein BST61_g7089 [Cercospora zeina]